MYSVRLSRRARSTNPMRKPTSSENSSARPIERSTFTDAPSSSLDHLFVYGTLRRVDPSGMNRLLAADAEYAGEASFAGRLVSAGRFPAAVPAREAGERVRGELWAFAPAVRERLLDRLDEYEGCRPGDPEPHGYVRVRVEVEREGGGRVECWTYLHAGAGLDQGSRPDRR
jgi:gamma-glutamylcyclotransferase (GGCT)/AIG2-like uncharacterized protein YtfP